MKTLNGEKLQRELERPETMREYEYTHEVCSFIYSIDEAGHRPLAGPVVAGAVILPKNYQILYSNDLKKVSEKKRELLLDEVRRKVASYGIGVVGSGRVDKINTLQATYKAMQEAVSQLQLAPETLLNDTITIPGIDLTQIPIVKRGTKSISTTAASILAKVTRDRVTVEYDVLYPEYEFVKHKEYRTTVHIQTLKRRGSCPVHRRSFIKNLV